MYFSAMYIDYVDITIRYDTIEFNVD